MQGLLDVLHNTFEENWAKIILDTLVGKLIEN